MTHAPLAGSDIIDAIPAGSCAVVIDQTGGVRPLGGSCDIGAFESLNYTRTVNIDVSESGVISYTTPGFTLYQSANPYTGFSAVDTTGGHTHPNALASTSYWQVRDVDGNVVDSFAIFPFVVEPGD